MEQGHDREHVGRVPMITLFGCAGLAIILLGAFWAYTKEFFLALNRSPRESEGARALYTFSVLAGAYSLALSHATSEIKDVSFWLTSVAVRYLLPHYYPLQYAGSILTITSLLAPT